MNPSLPAPAATSTDTRSNRPPGLSRGRLVDFIARVLVGGGYLYLGFVKVADPVGFLKAIRQYDLVQTPVLLNLIAVLLPWIEIACGTVLLLGCLVRGASLVSLAMLLPFSTLVLRRALQLQAAGALPFCAVRFDCGCGTGEIGICHKLLENGVLTLLSLWLLFRARPIGRADPPEASR